MAENDISVRESAVLPNGVNVTADTPDYAEWQALLKGDLVGSDSRSLLGARTGTTPEPSYSASRPSDMDVLTTSPQASTMPLALGVIGTTSSTPIIGFSASSQLPVGVDDAPEPSQAAAQPGGVPADPVDATFTVTTTGSGLVFNNSIVGTYTGNQLSEFEQDVTAAEDMLEKQATNSFTISVELDGESQGNNNVGASNDANSSVYSYSQVVSALKAKEANNPIGQIAVQHLPATDPSGGAGIYLYTPYARFLGLTNTTGGIQLVGGNYSFGGPYDTAVILNTYYEPDFGQDAIDALTHELSETSMGRVSSSMTAGQPLDIMDLFRYNANGQYDIQDGRDGKAAYFSYNGGQTTSASANLAFTNNFDFGTKLGFPDSGDSDDFTFPSNEIVGTSVNPSSVADIFGPVSTVSGLSQTDDQILESLGWAPTSHVAPTVSVQNMTVAVNGSTPASSMITGVSNPSGDAITAYEFIDEGGDGGHFSINGVAQPDNQRIEVLTNNLNSISYFGGPSAGSETLEIGVYDYTTNSYSAFSALTATTISTAADMLMRDINNGVIEYYDIQHNQFVAAGPMGGVGTEWQVLGVGDFSGNANETDMLMRDINNGVIEYYDIQHNQFVAAGPMGAVGIEWRVLGVGNLPLTTQS